MIEERRKEGREGGKKEGGDGGREERRECFYPYYFYA
jgi:hypothetical protein